MAIARKALIVTAVGVGLVAVALALWKIRVVIALLFVAVTIAAGMSPGVEALQAPATAYSGLRGEGADRPSGGEGRGGLIGRKAGGPSVRFGPGDGH